MDTSPFALPTISLRERARRHANRRRGFAHALVQKSFGTSAPERATHASYAGWPPYFSFWLPSRRFVAASMIETMPYLRRHGFEHQSAAHSAYWASFRRQFRETMPHSPSPPSNHAAGARAPNAGAPAANVPAQKTTSPR